MKINISKKTKKLIILYLVLLVILYVVIYVMPKATDAFETTQVLERGTLTISCNATGYIIKDESISLAGATGTIVHPVEEGTVVKKGTVLANIEAKDKDEEDDGTDVSSKYADVLEELDGFDMLNEGTKAQNSGVYSLTMDGHEKYFRIANMDKINRETVEGFSYKTIKLDRSKVKHGEPIFKVSSDDNWYIICWLDKADASLYEEGESVKLEIGEDSVNARVYEIKKENGAFRVVFFLNAYYEAFASTRTADMSVVASNNSGLLIDNECIVNKADETGVYVVNKDGEYIYKPIKIKATDGKSSVLYDGTFTNDKYELVETVNVYDEVLRHPESALEDDLKSGE